MVVRRNHFRRNVRQGRPSHYLETCFSTHGLHAQLLNGYEGQLDFVSTTQVIPPFVNNMVSTQSPVSAVAAPTAHPKDDIFSTPAADGEILPPYPKAIDALLADLKQKCLENPKAVRDAFTQAFGSADVDRAFVEKLEHLVDTVVDLKRGFSTVAQAVESFDLENYKDLDGKAMPKYKPEWDGYSAVRSLPFLCVILSGADVSYYTGVFEAVVRVKDFCR